MTVNRFSRFLSAVIIMGLAALSGCAGSAASGRGAGSTGLQLDDAIKQAAALISARVEAGTKIALLNFKSPADRFSEYFINELEASLLDHGKLTVIDRKEIDLIRGEMAFQMSGEVSDESIQMAGQKLGAQSIVSGQLMEIGDTYRMVVRVLSVETAAVAAQYRNDVRNDGRMRALLTERKHLEQESELGQQVRQKQQAPQAEVLVVAEGPVTATAVASDAGGKAGAAGGGSEKKAPAAVNPNKVYKVGDVGPAGGLIFYDKGDNIDGWRYMEVAPVEAEKKFAWWIQRHLRNVPDKGGFTAVGKGKDNTQELMKYVNENCGIYNNELPAILYCTTLEINGYKDWFLPSLDELHLMRQNLHIMGLDKFSNEERYWSSSSYRYVTFKFNENGWASAAAMGLVRPARRF